MVRGQRQRRAALPASDHLGAQQRLLLAAGGSFAEVAPVGRDAGVELAEHDVGAVAAEHLRGRHRRQAARLVGVAEDELARLDRPLPRVRAGDSAALHRRLADPVLEAEGGAPRRQLVAVLAPDHLHPGQVLVGAAGPLDHRRQPRGVGRQRRQRDVDLGGSERLLPVGWAALADVAELGRAGRHALPELRREAVQRLLRHAERLQARVGEGNGDPGAAGRVGGGPAGVDHRVQPPQQLPPRRAVVDAQQQVGADVGRRSWVEHPTLDVVELEADRLRRAHGVHGRPIPRGAREAGEDPGSAAPGTGRCRMRASLPGRRRRGSWARSRR